MCAHRLYDVCATIRLRVASRAQVSEPVFEKCKKSRGILPPRKFRGGAWRNQIWSCACVHTGSTMCAQQFGCVLRRARKFQSRFLKSAKNRAEFCPRENFVVAPGAIKFGAAHVCTKALRCVRNNSVACCVARASFRAGFCKVQKIARNFAPAKISLWRLAQSNLELRMCAHGLYDVCATIRLRVASRAQVSEPVFEKCKKSRGILPPRKFRCGAWRNQIWSCACVHTGSTMCAQQFGCVLRRARKFQSRFLKSATNRAKFCPCENIVVAPGAIKFGAAHVCTQALRCVRNNSVACCVARASFRAGF